MADENNKVVDTRIYFDSVKDPMLTQQSSRDECDINCIVERAKKGADIAHINPSAPMYDDFVGFPDFRESMLMVTQANTMFMRLDARIRERFGNDPGRLLDFLADVSNRDEAISLGLIDAPVDPVPVVPVSRVVDPIVKASVSDSKSKKPKASGDEE